MTNLDKALADITAIRTQMARGAEFRGYGPATVAATGFVALFAAAVQAFYLPDPASNVFGYLALWIATAAISVGLIGVEMVGRSRQFTPGSPGDDLGGDRHSFRPAWRVRFNIRSLPFCATERLMVPGLGRSYSASGSLPPAVACRARCMRACGIWGPAQSVSRSRAGRDAFSPWPRTFGLGQLFMRPSLSECRRERCRSLIRKAISGRFSYDGRDRVIHEKARLGVLTSLVAHPKGLAFGDLKQMCGLTDGNLSRHLQVLEEARLIAIAKGYDQNRPQTVCRITAQGRQRYLGYLKVLEQVVRDAASAAAPEPSTRLGSRRLKTA
jgi:DNA-binding transcriptional ArsR family regulator